MFARITRTALLATLLGSSLLFAACGDDDDDGDGGNSCVAVCDQIATCLGGEMPGCLDDCRADPLPSACETCILENSCEDVFGDGVACDDVCGT